MLTQLSTVKARLGISEFDLTHDGVLTNAIKALSGYFEKRCNRVFGRAVNAWHEFGARERELAVGSYPIEGVSKFELKREEAEGWVEQAGVKYLIRNGCVISLLEGLGESDELGRVTYTGGYVLPGGSVGPGQTGLPSAASLTARRVISWIRLAPSCT